MREIISSLEGKKAALESSLINHANEIELLKRKLFGPRAERTGTSELQLTLGDILEADARMQKQLDELTKPPSDEGKEGQPSPPPSKDRPKPKGRRDLSLSKLPTVVVEFTDPDLAAKGRLIGYDALCANAA